MIWQLVKRDPAWRIALIAMAGAAVAAVVLPPAAIGLFGWLVCMPWLTSQPPQRATLFQAALPIRACDLFLARVLALFAAVWLPVAIAATVFLLAGRPAEDAVILMEVGGGASVVVLATLSSRVREIAGSQWAPAISWAIVCAVGWPVALFVPRASVLPICAVLCAVLFWNIWRQLPTAFEVLPVKLGPQVSSRGSAAVPAFVWWPIVRSLFQPRTLLFLPLLVFLPAGGQWIYVCVFCVMPVLASVVHVSWALNLPVRRGALLAAALLPWATLLLIGVLLSNWFAPRPSIRLKWAASHQVAEVRPPLEFWRAGKAPVIAAPWGESWQPEDVRLRGVAVYNPYSLGAANSVRFFEWQFRRATEAVYGEPIDYAEYQRHRPTVRPLTRQARLAILNLSVCAACVMLLVNIVFVTLHWRCRQVFEWQNAAGWLLMAQLACAFLIDWAPGSSWAGPNISGSLVNALLLRVSAVLPAGLPAVALAAALPVALLWWTASRLFRGVELPLPAAVARS
jgi:hypothetical protein